MPLMKYKGVCNDCGYEWDVRKIDTKSIRVCPKCRSHETEVEQTEIASEAENASLDPENEFKALLSDCGINRARETISTIFFRGDIDNVEWLDEVLGYGSIPKNKRTLVKSAWFGLPSEMVDNDDYEVSQGGYMGQKKEKDELDEVIKGHEKHLAREIKKAEAEKLLRELKGEDNTSTRRGKLIRIPAINPDGTIMMGADMKPVFYEVTAEELKDMQVAQQYMQQQSPQKKEDPENAMLKSNLEIMKLFIGEKGGNKDNDEIRRLQEKIEETNTIMLENKIQGAFGSIMDEINKLKAAGGRGSELERLEHDIAKLKKFGLNVGSGNGVPIEEVRKDKVLDEGIGELRGLRDDLSRKLDPFAEIMADSAREQIKKQNPEQQKLTSDKSKVTDKEAEYIIKSLSPDSPESNDLDKNDFYKDMSKEQENIQVDAEPVEPPKETIAMIFSNDDVKVWDGKKDTVVHKQHPKVETEGDNDE